MTSRINVIEHYDSLITEGNDPFRDPPVLRAYMDKWDGNAFVEKLHLTPAKKVLEIGIGTGRIAEKVAPLCHHLTGIDISPKTIERAAQNLKKMTNITLVCADFSEYVFEEIYDVIYASLTMMHFENKKQTLLKVASLLVKDGIFCLSIDKNQNPFIDMGARKLRIYPDDMHSTIENLRFASMRIADVLETEFAHIIVSIKQ